MIPYRRQRAIESGATALLATDITIGDTVLIRRPGEVERSALEVLGALHIGHGIIRLRFDGFTHEASLDMPIAVTAFTEGGLRQYDPEADFGRAEEGEGK